MIEKISEVYNIDCMVGMAKYPDKYFELAIVDPPYGIEEITKKEVSNNRGKVLKNRMFNKQFEKFNKWDKSPNKDYFDELFRVSKNQIIWGGNYFDLPKYRCPVVWDKCQPWVKFSQVEIAWTSFNKPASLFKYDNRTGNKIHPTQKPIQLYKWLLNKYANQGDKILDTHLGSGSSRIAAYDLGFDFIGYELDKDYYEAQEKRFKEFNLQAKLF